MAIGFDARSVDALVVHGYPFIGLTHPQSVALQAAIHRLGSGLVAVPNGDLSETSEVAIDGGPAAFGFVVGALVARAGTAAVEDATTQSATVNDLLCEKSAATFEAARPHLDGVLTGQGVQPGEPGLFLIAAGPCASARLEGDAGAALRRVYGESDTEELLAGLTVSHESDNLPARIVIKGTFVLSARYR